MKLLFISWCILLVVSIVQTIRLHRLHKRYFELLDNDSDFY